MKAKDLITEAMSLPVEERLVVIDTLLKSLNPVESGSDIKWVQASQNRLKDIRSGKVATASADEVFLRIQARLSS